MVGILTGNNLEDRLEFQRLASHERAFAEAALARGREEAARLALACAQAFLERAEALA